MTDLRLARREVRVRAPGKVNLSLRVGPRDPDGYHRLGTVFQAVSVYEDVAARAADTLRVTVVGPGAERVPAGEENLALRAARLLAEHTGIADGIQLRVTKAVPVAGGMAGGSADAAAALLACDAFWGTALPREELAELGATLGADVPFLLMGQTAVGTGRGDLLTPALSRGEYHWAFGIQEDGLPTPPSSTSSTRSPRPRIPDLDSEVALLQALRAGDAVAVGTLLHNDLQAAALELRPDLVETLAVAEDAGALGVVISGSGPTVAALGRSRQHALALAAAMTAAGVVDSVLTASGPVHGARVLPGSDVL
ncbi:4-(cytidine 5'-diphospho)-2-C-methyl-D-erythritol kinase [Cellulomonas denverensis]|uniref:4-(cytidine 5'-diphospho)-2-C-methyl-D-erythritol kinase n=1 Tax=Cellulomonas denverensis TaxID=264297 RepID=UPI0035E9F4DB